jgi:DNA invertase Pin-like site-specific DNA recombinase
MTPTPKNPKRAVGYVRISKVKDEDENGSTDTSLETQEARIRAYCAAHGWTVVEVIVEPGRSAYKASRSTRPGFDRAMTLVETGAADVLVVWKLDRAARNTRDTLDLVDELRNRGAQFVSVTEQFDTTTPIGKVMLTLLAALAEMESATKSERVQEWQDHRRAAGGTPTGPRPFGYRRERNRLLIDKDEAKVVRDAVKRLLAGESLRSVAGRYDAAGVRGTNGGPLTPIRLRKTLLSPSIIACREMPAGSGVLVQSDAWNPLIDRATWDEVHALLTDSTRRLPNHTSTRRHWLSGIAKCGRCGASLHVSAHKTGHRYVCKACGLSIGKAGTEAEVERELLALLDRKAWRRLRQGGATGPDVSGLDHALNELTARYAAGDLDSTEWARLADALKAETASVPVTTLPDVPDLDKAWPTLDLAARRLVLSSVTESLTIVPARPGLREFDTSRVVWVPIA